MTLPKWLAAWLGIETGAEEGVSAAVHFAWPFSAAWTVLLLAALATVIALAYFRGPRATSRRYRGLLAALRLIAVLSLLLMLARPTLHLARTGLPTLVLLLDDSRSMTIEDAYDDETADQLERLLPQAFEPPPDEREQASDDAFAPDRWTLVTSLLTDDDAHRVRATLDRFRVRLVPLSTGRPIDIDDVASLDEALRDMAPTADATPLGRRVRGLLRAADGPPPAAIVVLSDGVTTEGPSLMDVAERTSTASAPLYCIGVGTADAPLDVAAHDLVAEDVAFLQDVVTIECRLTCSQAAGETVRVVLREAGAAAPLAMQTIDIEEDDASPTVRLTFRPEREGVHELELEAVPLPGEKSLLNNTVRHTLHVLRDKLRVLLVQSAPSYEYRFLRDLLQRERTIELDAILQDADPQHAEQTDGQRRVFPTDRAELFAYDAIILSDADPSNWTRRQLTDLSEFVTAPDGGGALIVAAGERHLPQALAGTPLEAVLPVSLEGVASPDEDRPRTQGFQVLPTELGLTFPGFRLRNVDAEAENATPARSAREAWADLPFQYWSVRAPRLKPAARVLAIHSTDRASDGSPLPLITMQYIGGGKVLFHAMPTWRWAYRADRAAYASYWIQTIHALCYSRLAGRSRPVAVATDRSEYSEGDVVRLLARLPDANAVMPAPQELQVTLRTDGSPDSERTLRRSSAAPGLYEAALQGLRPGRYAAVLMTPLGDGRPVTAEFTVRPRGDEFAVTEMNAVGLGRSAARTGGRYAPLVDADHVWANLPRGEQVAIESLPPRPLWNRWPMIAAVIICLAAEWILRRRANLT